MMPGARISALAFSVALGGWMVSAQTNSILYQNNFENAEIGKVPADMFVLDGGFAVRSEGGNKFLELPGTPLDTYAVQFGPAQADGVCAIARIKGSSMGRRYPAFGVGLNGVAGYRLQVSPAIKALELYKDQEAKTNAPFEWTSGKWTNLRLQVIKTLGDQWKIEGKAWVEGTAEPDHWTIVWNETQTPNPGRACVFGSPFSGTPVHYDDLIVRASTQ